MNKENKTNKAVVLCRIATTEQTGKDTGLEAQERRIDRIAKQLNLTVVKQWQAVGSGRSALKEIFEFCTENKDIKYLVASSPDRISRSIKQYNDYSSKFRRAGVRVITGSPVDMFIQDMRQALAANYHYQISRNVKRAMHHKASQGYAMTRAPFGYTATDVKGLFSTNMCGRNMSQILKLIANGSVSLKVGCQLLSEFVMCHTGKIPTRHELTKLACNPYYAGFISYGGQTFKGLHEPLVSSKQHEKIKQLFEAKTLAR